MNRRELLNRVIVCHKNSQLHKSALSEQRQEDDKPNSPAGNFGVHWEGLTT
jgi:hypothetical protein